MEVPKELRGYPSERLRVRIGNNIYMGLEETPQEKRDIIIPLAIDHLKTPNPVVEGIYPIGEETAKIWYDPVYRNQYYGGRDLAHPSGVGMKSVKVWP